MIKFKKLKPNATVPTQGSEYSAGYDLYAAIESDIEIAPHKTVMIGTGLAFEIPPYTFMGIFARSGLGVKKGITLSNGVGVVDSDYRGEIGVGLCNLSEEAYTIQPGERIAQMVIMNVETPMLNLCENLNETSRGEGGFGSTGK